MLKVGGGGISTGGPVAFSALEAPAAAVARQAHLTSGDRDDRCAMDGCRRGQSNYIHVGAERYCLEPKHARQSQGTCRIYSLASSWCYVLARCGRWSRSKCTHPCAAVSRALATYPSMRCCWYPCFPTAGWSILPEGPQQRLAIGQGCLDPKTIRCCCMCPSTQEVQLHACIMHRRVPWHGPQCSVCTCMGASAQAGHGCYLRAMPSNMPKASQF